jgi:excisionase family DNA binding protein
MDLAEKVGLTGRLPTADEVKSAAHAAEAIAQAMEIDGGLCVSGHDGESVKLAPAIGELIVELLGHVASEEMVTLVPTGALLTTQRAADILNVSRPFLSKLLKEGRIKHVMVGSHRRVPLDELLRYKVERDSAQMKVLNDLSELEQEMDKR